MKIKVQRSSFASALAALSSISRGTPTTPVLGCVNLVAAGDILHLSTTNLDSTMSFGIKVEAEEGFSIALNCKKLAAIVKELPSGLVEMSLDGLKVSIRSGGSLFKLNGLSSNDFPADVKIGADFSLECEADNLARELRKVRSAASTDEARYMLNSVLFEVVDSKCNLIATDGRRLGFSSIPVDINKGAPARFVIPIRFVDTLIKGLPQAQKVSFEASARQANFYLNLQDNDSGIATPIKLQTKLIEGVYPKYTRVIPKVTEVDWNSLDLPRVEFIESVKRASLMASDYDNKVVLKIEKDSLKIDCSSIEFGTSKESIQFPEGSNHAPCQSAFNPSFLLSALSEVGQDTAILHYKDELSPAIFSVADYKCVVMPLCL